MRKSPLIEINGQPATDEEYATLLYEICKLVQDAPTKEDAMSELFSLLDRPTQERELETQRELGQV